MIVNVEDPDVLRRALLGLEASSVHVGTPISTIQKVDSVNTMEVSVAKFNEVIDVINIISSILNSTNENHI